MSETCLKCKAELCPYCEMSLNSKGHSYTEFQNMPIFGCPEYGENEPVFLNAVQLELQKMDDHFEDKLKIIDEAYKEVIKDEQRKGE